MDICVVYDAPNVIAWPSIMIELLDNFELVIDPLFIWTLNVFVVGVYVKLKSAPLDTAATNPINDPLNVAAPIWLNKPKFLSDGFPMLIRWYMFSYGFHLAILCSSFMFNI